MKILQIGTGKVLWEGANLIGANLIGANLSGANLSRANLSYANLSRANLSYANLSYANLSYANLSYANLLRANLSGADLSRVNLSRANLIVGGQRSDGHRFLLYKTQEGVFVCAGCRYFSVEDARAHWRSTRKGTALGEESLALVDHLEVMAKIAGWIKN